MSFPTSPSNNDTITFRGIKYRYVTARTVWVRETLSYTLAVDISELTDTDGLLGSGFDGVYSSLTGTPTIPADLTDLGISDGSTGQLLTTDGAGGFTFADAPVSLPDQTGNTGKYLTTDGSAASWVDVATGLTWTSSTSAPTVGVIIGDRWYDTSDGKVYEYMSDGVTSIWIETSGIDIVINTEPPVSLSDILPDQTGNTGKYLTTDGTDATWVDVATGLTWTSSTSAPTVGVTIGDRWYDTSDGKVYEYMSDGTTQVWIETSGIDIGITTEPSGGVTTYATISELGAAANVAGSMGYVTATGNFYNNDGTGWAKVNSTPGTESSAPTIGTATVTSDTTATVDFTAPTYTGGLTITSYTATSTPGDITGTLSQAGSGTITVAGLTGSTTYTFTVTATNSAGTSAPSASSNSILTDETVTGTQKAIFGFGYNNGNLSITNLVSNTGVVASDTTGVGTARRLLAATGYGTDKAIFGFGYSTTNLTNLVSNTGVVATDTAGVGTSRYGPSAAGYGGDKALFGYGTTGTITSITNLVSNTGVVAANTTGVGQARAYPGAAGYGGDKAIFGFGYTPTSVSMTNLVSNTGVVSADTTGVGTARYSPGAAGYGGDKAIFGYGGGPYSSVTNLVSNTGVVATDTTGVGTAREHLAAAGYGGDTAIFGYGKNAANVSITNLVSNTGVVATDTTGVGTARHGLAAAGFSLS